MGPCRSTAWRGRFSQSCLVGLLLSLLATMPRPKQERQGQQGQQPASQEEGSSSEPLLCQLCGDSVVEESEEYIRGAAACWPRGLLATLLPGPRQPAASAARLCSRLHAASHAATKRCCRPPPPLPPPPPRRRHVQPARVRLQRLPPRVREAVPHQVLQGRRPHIHVHGARRAARSLGLEARDPCAASAAQVQSEHVKRTALICKIFRASSACWGAACLAGGSKYIGQSCASAPGVTAGQDPELLAQAPACGAGEGGDAYCCRACTVSAI